MTPLIVRIESSTTTRPDVSYCHVFEERQASYTYNVTDICILLQVIVVGPLQIQQSIMISCYIL